MIPLEEPENKAPREYIFELFYIAFRHLNQNTFDPMLDEDGNAAQFDLFLPAADAEMGKASRFAEKYTDRGALICKCIACGKYDFPIREMTIKDNASLNSSAEMITRMSPEQIRQLTKDMAGFKRESDMEAACKFILDPEKAMNCSF